MDYNRKIVGLDTKLLQARQALQLLHLNEFDWIFRLPWLPLKATYWA